jgi:hypothetical protein
VAFEGAVHHSHETAPGPAVLTSPVATGVEASGSAWQAPDPSTGTLDVVRARALQLHRERKEESHEEAHVR